MLRPLFANQISAFWYHHLTFYFDHNSWLIVVLLYKNEYCLSHHCHWPIDYHDCEILTLLVVTSCYDLPKSVIVPVIITTRQML
jgi:hypothetical protein